ncbi:MAG: AraC family transcriptional regulator [Treponema sp.]|nr:AraC family transcriptional regulator [Treponema sp.]MCL2250457.1 AraC family transcriptional regulator [Treponema sp.]
MSQSVSEPIYHYYFKNQFRPLGSLSLFEVSYFTTPPSYVLPIERPDAYALYLIDEGKGIYTIGGTEYLIKEYDIFCMYPGVPVHCESDQTAPLKMFAMSFDGVDARLLLNAAGFEPTNPVHTLVHNDAVSVSKAYDFIYQWRGQEVYNTIQSTATLYAFLSKLVKINSLDQSVVPPGWTGTVHFQKAIDYIKANYCKPISAKDIANSINLSRSRLYSIFMEQIFISPQQYLEEYRIRKAVQLLEQRQGSLKEISVAVGFEDQLFFSRIFKQIIGKTPTNFINDLLAEETEKQKQRRRKNTER